MDKFKKIYLGKGIFSLVDEWNYDKLNKYTWYLNKHHYAVTTINSTTIMMHRFIMNLTDEDLVVDHIDGDRSDNRECNLRICSQAQNMLNKLPRRNGTSKFNGVIFEKDTNKWLAKITTTLNGERLWCNIGFYDDEETAAYAFNIVASELRGEYAKLNDVDKPENFKIKKRSLDILRKRLNIKLDFLG